MSAYTQAADSAFAQQEGGSHYKDMAIQPAEYIHRNNIGFMEGCAIKYLSRWRNKNGIEDLKKARHFIDMLIELERKETEGESQSRAFDAIRKQPIEFYNIPRPHDYWASEKIDINGHIQP